jgi:hypothetical protein
MGNVEELAATEPGGVPVTEYRTSVDELPNPVLTKNCVEVALRERTGWMEAG